MKYITLPVITQPKVSLHGVEERRVTFYLAMEEYVARHLVEPDCFFIWQVAPSVIFGRNQLIANEVNLAFCRSRGIGMYRRKSGGGCVYADRGNLMLSLVTTGGDVGFIYNRYVNMVVLVLQRMGIDARATGRNDVVIDGRKVSGTAYYRTNGRSIVHGTLLYDTDMENMVGAITPSSEKLLSKGVESVRQRIALLKDHTDMTIEQLKQFLRNELCDGEVKLSAADVEAIEKLEQEYLTDAFIFGNNPKYTLCRHSRVEGVGEMDLRLELKNNTIVKADLVGDYFLVGDLDGLLDCLKGVERSREALEAVLPPRVDDVIPHFERNQFINLLLL
jgi:lipoyltransferase/lipoate-protein ligase